MDDYDAATSAVGAEEHEEYEYRATQYCAAGFAQPLDRPCVVCGKDLREDACPYA